MCVFLLDITKRLQISYHTVYKHRDGFNKEGGGEGEGGVARFPLKKFRFTLCKHILDIVLFLEILL